ncbi:hypothetical protein ACIQUB_08285 [Rhizobium sp. NPDC090275]|uniref:hypothetical protein n=1 Tax=Rhizobium sp. NPDC090275 TaxID=3364498 RepID=UPI000DD59AB4
MKHSSYQLTLDDAVQVWIRRWAGEYQHEIAASYGVNQGRVNEVLKHKRHPNAEAIAKLKRGMH